jgi:hypothetical protein
VWRAQWRSARSRARAQAFPSKNMRGWSRPPRAGAPLLKTQFEYKFFPGAAGQVGYEVYLNKRDKDGHNLLFGDMGPEMSPFRRIEDVIDAARKKTVNVAVTRLPHPASLGALALARATKAKFNLVPYGGGNPTMVSVLNGEADCGAQPVAAPRR